MADLHSMCRSPQRSCAGICFFESNARRGLRLAEMGGLNYSCRRQPHATFLTRCIRTRNEIERSSFSSDPDYLPVRRADTLHSRAQNRISATAACKASSDSSG